MLFLTFVKSLRIGRHLTPFFRWCRATFRSSTEAFARTPSVSLSPALLGLPIRWCLVPGVVSEAAALLGPDPSKEHCTESGDHQGRRAVPEAGEMGSQEERGNRVSCSAHVLLFEPRRRKNLFFFFFFSVFPS